MRAIDHQPGGKGRENAGRITGNYNLGSGLHMSPLARALRPPVFHKRADFFGGIQMHSGPGLKTGDKRPISNRLKTKVRLFHV